MILPYLRTKIDVINKYGTWGTDGCRILHGATLPCFKIQLFDIKTSKHSFAYCCCEQASHEGTGTTHVEDLDLNLGAIQG